MRLFSKPAFSASLALYGISILVMFGRFLFLTTDLIIGSAPPERAGAASALSETSAEFGGAIGIAIFGSIGVAVYRSVLDGAIPHALTPEAIQAARATLAGALDAAQQLGGAAGQELASTAHNAFLKGLRLCAGISVAGSAALAVFAGTRLRQVQPSAAVAQDGGVEASPV